MQTQMSELTPICSAVDNALKADGGAAGPRKPPKARAKPTNSLQIEGKKKSFRRVWVVFLQSGLEHSNVSTPRCSSYNVVITPQVVVR